MTDKTGAPPCSIYIRIKAVADKKAMADTLFKMRQMNMAINRASGYTRNNHIIEITAESREETELLIQVIQHEGALAIIKDNIALAGELKADGVLISEHYKTAREALGEDAIIGMTGSDIEQGADYAILPADIGAIAKLSASSEALIVSRSPSITNDNCGSLAKAGASYVDATDYIFGYEKGAMQAAVNLLHALDLASQRDRSN